MSRLPKYCIPAASTLNYILHRQSLNSESGAGESLTAVALLKPLVEEAAMLFAEYRAVQVSCIDRDQFLTV